MNFEIGNRVRLASNHQIAGFVVGTMADAVLVQFDGNSSVPERVVPEALERLRYAIVSTGRWESDPVDMWEGPNGLTNGRAIMIPGSAFAGNGGVASAAVTIRIIGEGGGTDAS